MKNKNIFLALVLIVIVIITNYYFGFTLSKIIIPLIMYIAFLKKDSWIDKEFKK